MLGIQRMSCPGLFVAVLGVACGGGAPPALPPEPAGLTYATNPAIYFEGMAITADVPHSSGGSIVSYSVSPALPAGLTLDGKTGIISGTPTGRATSRSYSITAANAGGSVSATLALEVHGLAPTGSMASPRTGHTATLLADGRVLIAGGASGRRPSTILLDTAEIYDPATGAFSPVASRMSAARWRHAATLLPNGKVLLAGGMTASGAPPYLASAELFDPATNTFSATGDMRTYRATFTATLLGSGKVLVAGGDTGASWVYGADLYDPATGVFTATGSMACNRNEHTATLLADGTVLMAGGSGSGDCGATTAELYAPSTGLFSTVPGAMSGGHIAHSAILLPGGWAAIMGGTSSATSTHFYLPATKSFSSPISMLRARVSFQTARLTDGTVVLIGGCEPSSGTCYQELLSTGSSPAFTLTPSTTVAFWNQAHTATVLLNGDVLVVGGTDPGGVIHADAYLF